MERREENTKKRNSRDREWSMCAVLLIKVMGSASRRWSPKITDDQQNIRDQQADRLVAIADHNKRVSKHCVWNVDGLELIVAWRDNNRNAQKANVCVNNICIIAKQNKSIGC